MKASRRRLDLLTLGVIYKMSCPEDKDTNLYFIKLAEKKQQHNTDSLLKDIVIVGGGTALGATAGYGLGGLLKKRYQASLDATSPNQRLKYLVPAATVLTGAASLVPLIRSRYKNKKRDRDGKNGSK